MTFGSPREELKRILKNRSMVPRRATTGDLTFGDEELMLRHLQLVETTNRDPKYLSS